LMLDDGMRQAGESLRVADVATLLEEAVARPPADGSTSWTESPTI